MIAVPPGVRILLATRPVDFRKGMDGLAALVQQALQADPFAGDVFIFRPKRADRVKILVYDGPAWSSCHHDTSVEEVGPSGRKGFGVRSLYLTGGNRCGRAWRRLSWSMASCSRISQRSWWTAQVLRALS